MSKGGGTSVGLAFEDDDDKDELMPAFALLNEDKIALPKLLSCACEIALRKLLWNSAIRIFQSQKPSPCITERGF